MHERLAAAEGAIIKTDERLDALENDEQSDDHAQALIACDARIAALEETLTECLNRLQQMETAQAEIAVVEAEAEVAEAEAEIAQAEAITAMVEAEQEAIVPEETVSEEVTELEPEPESENEGGPENNQSSNWLERLLTLR